MQKLKGTAVVAHGGGPTAVINASLAGVIEERRRHGEIVALYGARHGIQGVLAEDFLDLDREDPNLIELIARTPGSALGSCRYKVKEPDYERILEVFRAHNVRYFFYTGGNDSMDTTMKVAQLARQSGYELRAIGIPKTIDNDLAETDHSPGYGSAALFYACALRDIGADLRELPGRVTVVEVMGRNAGWLTAATALARHQPDDPPHLIYLPERPLPAEKLLADVEAVYRRLGYAVVAVCEGQRDEKGEPFGADLIAADGFAHALAGNLAHALSQLIARRLKLRARSEKPGLLGRTSAAFVSESDRQEARICGREAVHAALEGESEKMVTLVREPGAAYRVRTGLVELERVANVERRFPTEWIHPEGNDVLGPFLEYARPLTGEIAPRARLSGTPVPRRLG
ncbi:MAG: 6-phosphofructokinase [Bryobacterales bacterium]|nr:6-phosphofructokinase [Bryobacteraceae bacterium]MDW8130493.1 6-phosphofructokinase [Bryobacterales bacterium]